MIHQSKTKQELVDELNAAHQRIAELEASEETQLANAAKVNAILEVLPNLMFRLSKNGTYLEFYSPSQDKLLLKPEDFLGKTFDDVLPPVVARLCNTYLQRALKQQKKQIFEYYLDLPEDEHRYFEAHMVAISSDEVLALIYDITPRKNAEIALSESEFRIRALLNATSETSMLITTDGTIIAINAAAASDLGKSVEDAIGTNVWDYFSAEIAESRRKQGEQVVETGKPIYYEDTRMGRYFDNTVYPVFDDEGNVKQLAIFARDITERKHSEQQIRQLGERFSILFHSTPAPLALVQLDDGQVVEVNTAFEKAFGYTYDEVVGQSTIDLNLWVHDDDRRSFAKHLREEQFIENKEFKFRTKGGEIRTFFGSFTILNINQQPLILSALIDISEHNRLEKMAKKAEILQIDLEKEKEVRAVKDRFLSVVSHEFRTPLAVIQTSSQLLGRYFNELTVERRQELVLQIGEQITKLTEMIDDMLAISQTESKKTEFLPKLMDLESFCYNIFEQIQFADTANHQFEFVSHIPLPAVMVDGNLLNHALANLLTNAMKYSPENSKITCELTYEQNQIIVSIRDEGIGIPEEDQVNLFEPFHRASNVGNIKGDRKSVV